MGRSGIGSFKIQSWWDLLRPACYRGMWILLLGLCVGIPRDMRATMIRRRGRLVRGPLVVTRDQFNRRRNNRGRTDGIGFTTEEPKSMGERLFARYPHGPMVRIPREDETRHHLFMGTTASGKTTAIKQVMIQARYAGHSVIIHDPTLEYIRSFYDPLCLDYSRIFWPKKKGCSKRLMNTGCSRTRHSLLEHPEDDRVYITTDLHFLLSWQGTGRF